MPELNIEQIQKALPQRFPFLMIDRVVEQEPRKKVVAIKNVSINESFFSGHFPGRPIMPGVLIIEAMAQTMIMLFYDESAAQQEKQKIYYLGSVKVRFLNPVFPGDQIRITAEPLKILGNTGIVSVMAQVGDKEIAKGELSFSSK